MLKSGPTSFTVDENSYYEIAMTTGRKLICLCGFGTSETSIYVYTPDRRDPYNVEYRCIKCLPKELL